MPAAIAGAPAGIAPAEAVVRIRGLTVLRGGRRALADIDLDIQPSLVTGLLGPSGSGKTTLLRAIVGVQTVQRGDIRIFGIPAGTPELRHRVAYVTQAPSVYGDLSVHDNLRYFASILGAGREHLNRCIATVGLEVETRRLVRTLSGGERSRVSLAVALLGDPQLLILDEPTVGLDPVLRAELWTTFHRLATQGATVVVSTHVMDEAGRCDELILMRDGRIVAAAPPPVLLEQTHTDGLEAAFLALAERT